MIKSEGLTLTMAYFSGAYHTQLAPVGVLGYRFMLQPLKDSQPNIEIVKSVFPVMFLAQYGRQPGSWEMTIGLAFIFGDLVIGQPPRDNLIRAIYQVALDVVNHISLNGQFTRRLAPPPEVNELD